MSKGGLPLYSHEERGSFLVFPERNTVCIPRAQELSTTYSENCNFLFYIKLRKKEQNKTKKQTSTREFWALLDPLKSSLFCLLKQFSCTLSRHWLCWHLLSNHALRIQLETCSCSIIYFKKKNSFDLTSPGVFHFDKDQSLKLKESISPGVLVPDTGEMYKGRCHQVFRLWSYMFQGWLEKRTEALVCYLYLLWCLWHVVIYIPCFSKEKYYPT